MRDLAGNAGTAARCVRRLAHRHAAAGQSGSTWNSARSIRPAACSAATACCASTAWKAAAAGSIRWMAAPAGAMARGSQLTLDAPGAHAVQVRQWDAAGNVSALVAVLLRPGPGAALRASHAPPGTLQPPLAPPVAACRRSPIRAKFPRSAARRHALSRACVAAGLGDGRARGPAGPAPRPRTNGRPPPSMRSASAPAMRARNSWSCAAEHARAGARRGWTCASRPRSLATRGPTPGIQLSLTLEDGRACPPGSASMRAAAAAGGAAARLRGEIALRLTARDGQRGLDRVQAERGRHAAERQAPAGSGLAEQMQRATQARTAAGAAQRLRG